MPERAGLFEGEDDFDVSTFRPKKMDKGNEALPVAEAIRAVSEASSFQSREPVPPEPSLKREHRRRRTGRNVQLNVKVAPDTYKKFYELADQYGWVLGETLEKAVAALKRELATGD